MSIIDCLPILGIKHSTGVCSCTGQFWMAPELLRTLDGKTQSQKGDIYAGAVILKEIFSRSSSYSESDEVSPPGKTTACDPLHCTETASQCWSNTWNVLQHHFITSHKTTFQQFPLFEILKLTLNLFCLQTVMCFPVNISHIIRSVDVN